MRSLFSNYESESEVVFAAPTQSSILQIHCRPTVKPVLNPQAGRLGLPGLKCTAAVGQTYQQTVACGLWGSRDCSKEKKMWSFEAGGL